MSNKRSRPAPGRSRPNPKPAAGRTGARTGAGQGAAARANADRAATFAERAAQTTARRRPTTSAPEPEPGALSLSHRGVRWHRSERGTVRWWNTDSKQWVRFQPGADAPPAPPGWDVAAGGGPATNKAARKSWRSPYRILPLTLFVIILVVGITQATKGSGGQTAAEAKASAALAGRCLAQNGTADGHPRYSTKSVACSTPTAAVRVVRVLPGTPGSPGCPAGETALSLPYAGVRYPHVECVVAARPTG